MRPIVDAEFWQDRAVLLTGHTGFKGAWMALWLEAMGARVAGLSDEVPTSPSLYELAGVGDGLSDYRGDVRDPTDVLGAFARSEPELVVHLAAQPFVRRSYADPRGTFETNVMGTVNVLEAARVTPSVRVVICVTTDKCYANDPLRPPRPFVEGDAMGGSDPYSSSKGCAELVIEAYRRAFFEAVSDGAQGVRLGSVRAGNVIGGGDWGEDRLIPDFMRGVIVGEPIPVRNPHAVRPWQHVLNPLSGYLRLAELLYASPHYQGAWNFGPDAGDVRTVSWIADRITEKWPDELCWQLDSDAHPHEAHYLALDSSKARERLGWAPTWDLDEALDEIVEWYGALHDGEDMRAVTLAQISAFEKAGALV
jgi:CDP-glucose 4,6-dehydratase